MLPRLVRDNVPRGIIAMGNVPTILPAEPGDRVAWLFRALHDQIDDFKQDGDPSTLVDMYEVLRGLWAVRNPGAPASLSETAAAQRATQGGYTEFTILVGVRIGR
jgi:predicted house-cleaning noncanonical NTP pyrophosphatase (MazG superfamily)